MSNKDDGTNLHNVIDLVQQTIKEVVSFEMNTRNTNTNSYETQSQRWQYCTQCAYEFMLPDNMKQLLHCAQQQGMNFLLDVLLFKLLHYPLIFKALRRHYKSLLNYWFNSCRYMFRHWTWKALHEKSFGRGGPSPDKYKMITFGMMSVSFLQTQQYFLLQWMETGYFKRKHFNFIMKRNPNILRDLLQILRVKYIKLGPQSVFNGKQKLIADSIELDTTYRLALNLIAFSRTYSMQTSKYKLRELFEFVDGLYDETQDKCNEYSLMLKFGQRYIYELFHQSCGRYKIKQMHKLAKHMGSECQNPKCHKSNALKVCKGCKLVHYCSVKCQKLDWIKFGHRTRCILFR